MQTILNLIKDFYIEFLAVLGSGAGGWFLKKLDYKREKEKNKSHLKAKLLDDILNQCRKLERKLKNYPSIIKSYKAYLDDNEIDPETGYPNNIFDMETEPAYRKFISELDTEKESLRHLHQDYIIKTKSDEIKSIQSIDNSLVKIISYENNNNFTYEDAFKEHQIVITNLRTIHHEVKKNYPEEVPVEN